MIWFMIFIWLWAGYWLGRPSMVDPAMTRIPTWARVAACLIGILLWPILFPLWQLMRERVVAQAKKRT
jgi:hypothetical protein